MQQRVKIDRNDYQLSFFPELETVFPDKEGKPLIKAFIHLDNKINNQQQQIDQGLKSIDIIQQVQKTMKVDIKKDLFIELATKADISELRGEMLAGFEKITGEINTKYSELELTTKADINELRGEMRAGFEKITGEINTKYTELDSKIQTKHKELRAEMQSMAQELRAEMQTKHIEMLTKYGEMQTKHEELRGEMLSLHKELRGEMIAGFEMIRSDINNLRIWFKVFAFSALAIVFMFSPNFIQLLKYVKIF